MKDYVRDMRELVGSRPLILAGACVILQNQKGHILMNLRTDNECWGLPGGFMEIGEDLEATAKREVWEETELVIDRLTLLDVFSGAELYYEYPNGDKVHNVTAVYLCQDFTGELRANEESFELRFFDPQDLPDRVTSTVRPILKAYRDLERAQRLAPDVSSENR